MGILALLSLVAVVVYIWTTRHDITEMLLKVAFNTITLTSHKKQLNEYNFKREDPYERPLFIQYNSRLVLEVDLITVQYMRRSTISIDLE